MNAPTIFADPTLVGGAVARAPAHAHSRRVQSLNPQSVLRTMGQSLVRLPPSSWLLVDALTLAAAVQIGFHAFDPFSPQDTPHIALWQAIAIFPFTTIIASLIFGLYERETLMSRARILTRLTLVVGLSVMLAYAVIYVVMYATVSRRVTGLALAVFFAAATSLRLVAWWAIHRLRRGLLVVGPRNLFESFTSAQAEGFLHEYKLLGYASPGPTGGLSASDSSRDRDPSRDLHLSPECARPESPPPLPRGDTAGFTTRESKGADTLPPDNDPLFLGTVREQLPNLARLSVTDIVVGGGIGNENEAMQWIVPSLQAGCRVTNEATFYEKATGQILTDGLDPNWFLFADLKVHCEEHATLKRVGDLLIVVIALCLSAPLWPLLALAVKLCDGGRVFYSQERVGQHGRVFRLYKFRTMRADAENGKSIWCSPNDPRVTRAGRILRRMRLDELPQLFNVLLGQMSIVGPRPERPDIVQELSETIPYYAERHLVKPGITGWAQISFRYGASIEDAKRKLRFDLYYLKHMSLELDMMILFRTAGTFLRGAC